MLITGYLFLHRVNTAVRGKLVMDVTQRDPPSSRRFPVQKDAQSFTVCPLRPLFFTRSASLLL